MTYDELSEDQRTEVKQRILEERNEARGEGTSCGELADADNLVSNEDARDWADGVEFSDDDFACTATSVVRVRVTWPLSKVFQVPASTDEEALERMRLLVNSGNISPHDPGWEADDGDDVPKIEIEED